MDHNLKTSDLPLYEERTLPITPSLIRYVLERRRNMDTATVETSLLGCSLITQSTGREFGMTIYSTYPSNPANLTDWRNLSFQDILAIPALGNRTSVGKPILDPQIYQKDLEDKLFLPIFDIHTHPSSSTIISNRNDEGNGDIPAMTNRYLEKLQLGDKVIEITNPSINIIAAQTGLGIVPHSTAFLFYQFTGDTAALVQFKKEYDQITERIRQAHSKGPFSGSREGMDASFAAEMRRSGAFKARYFPPGDSHSKPKGHMGLYAISPNGFPRLNPNAVSKIAQEFTYTCKVKRTS